MSHRLNPSNKVCLPKIQPRFSGPKKEGGCSRMPPMQLPLQSPAGPAPRKFNCACWDPRVLSVPMRDLGRLTIKIDGVNPQSLLFSAVGKKACTGGTRHEGYVTEQQQDVPFT